MNQLASAHERGLIGKGSSVHISTNLSDVENASMIKLKVKVRGSKDYVDVEQITLIKTKNGFFS